MKFICRNGQSTRKDKDASLSCQNGITINAMSTQEPSVQELPVKELIKKENINQTKELWKLVKETKKPEKPIL